MWIFLVTFEFIWLPALLALLELTFYLMPCQQQPGQGKKSQAMEIAQETYNLFQFISFCRHLVCVKVGVMWVWVWLFCPLLMLMLPTFDFGMSRRSRSAIVLVCVCICVCTPIRICICICADFVCPARHLAVVVLGPRLAA